MNSESLALNPSMSLNIGAESGEKKEMIATMMASAATVATEASSMELPIETNFMMAAASHKSLVSQSEKRLGDSLATLSLSDKDFGGPADDGEYNGVVSAQPEEQAAAPSIDEQDELLENSTQATCSGAANNAFLRPRIKELHHHVFAMDILANLDDDDDDDTTDESSIQRTHRVQGGREQEEREEHFMEKLKDGLEFLSRPRKSEKHIFFVRDYLLDVGEDDDDDNDVNSDDRQ